MKYLFVIFFIVFVAGAGCTGGSGKKQPLALKGCIDLSHWDFENDGPAELTGEWEFHWEELLDSKMIDNRKEIHPARFIRLPGIWNNQVFEGKKLPGRGYATYRLRVQFGKGIKSDGRPVMALMVRDMGTAYALFINGEKKAHGGRVASGPERSVPGYWPSIADFVPGDNETDIILHLSNYHHRKGGAWEKIILGSERSIHEIREKKLILDFFLIGAIFLIGCYHMVLFTMRKKEISHLYFGLICAIISVRILVTGEFYLVRMFPELPWAYVHMLEYLTVFACIPLFFMFLQSLFPAEFNKKVLRVYQSIGIVFSGIVIIATSWIYTHIMPYFHVVSFLICGYGMYALIVALARKRDGAIPFMIGFAVLFVSVSNDFLYNNRIIYTGYAVPYGLLLFIFSQAFLLSRRFTRSFIEVETMSKELEGKNIRLLNLDKLKDEFLAAVSHELRTPLHGIIGITQSMIEYSDTVMSDESRHNLGLIAVSGKRLAYLIEDISDFARLKSRDIVLSRNPVDLKTIADIVIALSRPLIGNRKIAFLNEISPNAPPVFADENRVHQILHNLVGNAVKFTEDGRIAVSAEVVRDDAGEDWVRVSVSDTGIGIPEERQEIIFEQYRQADDSIQRQYGGAGIGLSVARELVDLHGGTLDVRSLPGEGSVFSFTLPVCGDGSVETRRGKESQVLFLPPIHADTAGQDIKPPDGVRAGTGGHLLIVDDDIINLHVITNFLSSEKYSVVAVTGGIEAMNLITQRPFDLLLLDIMMPKVSGYEICAELRKRYSLYELPIIFLTARNRIDELIHPPHSPTPSIHSSIQYFQ
jgi:two-component system, sensor histidine kinase ChiS